MRVVIAVRVSPRPAENVRYSPEIQESDCREWCRANNHEVVGIVRDILVSGGSRNRFDSILTALDELRPDAFLFADLSRWTRDTPTRFYAMRALLEDAGVRIMSVAEPFVGSDQPFSDTITTAVVEANYQQRIVSNRKTSAGVRKAWASGKRWGHCFGWTFHPAERHDHEGLACEHRGEWTQDRDLILSFYRDYIAGMSIYDMSRRYGIDWRAISGAIKAQRQVEVVGEELWERAQAPRQRTARRDARQGNIYRALLVCPFCGKNLQQASDHWGQYRCSERKVSDHGWIAISARREVAPVVREVLERTTLPKGWHRQDEEPDRRMTGEAIRKAQDRLSIAWANGRLSDDRYDAEMARLDAEAKREHRTPEPRLREVVDSLGRMAPLLDCTSGRHSPHTCSPCPRVPVVGTAVNDVLRAFLDRIEVTVDREVIVHVKPEYHHYVRS